MDLNRLTQKSQAALQAAQSTAVRRGHPEVDGEHLLLALLDQPDGLVPRLLTAAGVDVDRLRENLTTELDRRPSVRGPGAEPGHVMITPLRVTDAARRQIAGTGFDPVFGARPLRRYIQREAETRIGRALLGGDVQHGATIVVDLDEVGELTVTWSSAPATPEPVTA